jgi:hypothetical protein
LLPIHDKCHTEQTKVILADNALLAAFVTGSSTIGADIIHAVVKDRGLPDTQRATPSPAIKSIKRRKAGSGISSVRRDGNG